MPEREDKTFENDCTKCREMDKEFHNQDMELYIDRTRAMIKAEFQTREDIIKAVVVLQKNVYWGKVAIATLSAAILFLFIYLFG